jgi:hypothetical protein
MLNDASFTVFPLSMTASGPPLEARPSSLPLVLAHTFQERPLMAKTTHTYISGEVSTMLASINKEWSPSSRSPISSPNNIHGSAIRDDNIDKIETNNKVRAPHDRYPATNTGITGCNVGRWVVDD